MDVLESLSGALPVQYIKSTLPPYILFAPLIMFQLFQNQLLLSIKSLNLLTLYSLTLDLNGLSFHDDNSLLH